MNQIIDEFVVYLVRQRCEGCKECEPLMPVEWNPEGFACCEEGFAKWLLERAKEFKDGRTNGTDTKATHL